MSTITLTGTAGADPDLKFSQRGDALASLRVAESRRRKGDDGAWETYRTDWHDVTIWGAKATHVAETVRKGDILLIVGDLESREVERDGQRRTYWQIKATEVAVVRAKNTAPSGGSQQGYRGAPPSQRTPSGGEDPWTTQSRSEAAVQGSWGVDDPSNPPF